MIHKALKVIRQFHEMQQAELSVKLNISKPYLSELESGKKPISSELLNKYAEIFNIPASSLVFFSEKINKENNIPQKFRHMFASQIIEIMEWMVRRDESKKNKV